MHSSLYSFELVNRDAKDRYPTSKDYLAFIRKYLTQYSSKVIKDWVTSVENHSSHSIVRTQSGRIFETKHLVISTAFKRKMNQLLNEFDYASAKNKTIAITAMGDSVNLMISKLIPYNNRIVLITNGFMLLDKLYFTTTFRYTGSTRIPQHPPPIEPALSQDDLYWLTVRPDVSKALRPNS